MQIAHLLSAGAPADLQPATPCHAPSCPTACPWPAPGLHPQIENRAYYGRAFRKLHIEVAARQDGLQVRRGPRGQTPALCTLLPSRLAPASPPPPITHRHGCFVVPHLPRPPHCLQVFHCVMYPRLEYDLPILSMDLVANAGRVSLAIVDPCPLSPGLQLPPVYEQPVRWAGPAGRWFRVWAWRVGAGIHVEGGRSRVLAKRRAAFWPVAFHLARAFHLAEAPPRAHPSRRPVVCCRELQARYQLESNRSIPEWGAAIFSPLCVIVRPDSSEEVGRFLKYALALTQLHVQVGESNGGWGVGVGVFAPGGCGAQAQSTHRDRGALCGRQPAQVCQR